MIPSRLKSAIIDIEERIAALTARKEESKARIAKGVVRDLSTTNFLPFFWQFVFVFLPFLLFGGFFFRDRFVFSLQFHIWRCIFFNYSSVSFYGFRFWRFRFWPFQILTVSYFGALYLFTAGFTGVFDAWSSFWLLVVWCRSWSAGGLSSFYVVCFFVRFYDGFFFWRFHWPAACCACLRLIVSQPTTLPPTPCLHLMWFSEPTQSPTACPMSVACTEPTHIALQLTT